MSKINGSPFKIDYRDLAQVIAYCKKLGGACIVVKHEDRPNYNIVHASRTDLYKPKEVIWTTGQP